MGAPETVADRIEEWADTTLRGHLGLPNPANRHTTATATLGAPR